jgi:hypothetical protein
MSMASYCLGTVSMHRFIHKQPIRVVGTFLASSKKKVVASGHNTAAFCALSTA